MLGTMQDTVTLANGVEMPILGVVTIPKSVKRDHLRSNADIFDFTLTEEEIRLIDSLDQGRRVGPDPADVGC